MSGKPSAVIESLTNSLAKLRNLLKTSTSEQEWQNNQDNRYTELYYPHGFATVFPKFQNQITIEQLGASKVIPCPDGYCYAHALFQFLYIEKNQESEENDDYNARIADLIERLRMFDNKGDSAKAISVRKLCDSLNIPFVYVRDI